MKTPTRNPLTGLISHCLVWVICVGATMRGYSATRLITLWQDTSIIGSNVSLLDELTNAVAIADPVEYGYERLAITADQRLIPWGTSIFTPFGWSNIVAIACGGQYLELESDGSVRAWVYDFTGDMSVPDGLSNVVAIAAGRNLSLALKSDGTVVGWGATSIIVPAGLSNIVAIAAGSAHALALRADGTVFAWGSNEGGQADVPSGLTNVIRIAAGSHHSLALKSDGTLMAWGSYGSRDGTYFGLTQQVPVTVPSNVTNIAAMTGGEFYTLALKTDGTIVEWGAIDSSVSYVPAGKKPAATKIPIIVPAGLTNVIAISHGLALIGDGPTVLGLQQAPMTKPILDADGYRCLIQSESGRVYRLEYTSSLSIKDWIALPLVAGNGDVVTLRDSTAGGGRRFYRVRRW
jgi:hypothetical protein